MVEGQAVLGSLHLRRRQAERRKRGAVAPYTRAALQPSVITPPSNNRDRTVGWLCSSAKPRQSPESCAPSFWVRGA